MNSLTSTLPNYAKAIRAHAKVRNVGVLELARETTIPLPRMLTIWSGLAGGGLMIEEMAEISGALDLKVSDLMITADLEQAFRR